MKIKFRILLLILFLLFSIIFIRKFTTSLFFKKTDRVKLVIYGNNTTLYSIGFGMVSYSILFPANLEILVPGGYGYYRVGAIAKLASLEKNPDLIRRAFTSATSSFVDVYFYPKKTDIYYDNNEKNNLPKLEDILFYQSNASFFDKIYIYLNLINKNERKFNTIDHLPVISNKSKMVIDEEEFIKKYQGLFYKKVYRNENKNIQILYKNNYNTALLISRIIEGEGIRVVDISQSNIVNKQCSVLENVEDKFSLSGADIGLFFRCKIDKGQTDTSDIILSLGELEREWKVE